MQEFELSTNKEDMSEIVIETFEGRISYRFVLAGEQWLSFNNALNLLNNAQPDPFEALHPIWPLPILYINH